MTGFDYKAELDAGLARVLAKSEQRVDLAQQRILIPTPTERRERAEVDARPFAPGWVPRVLNRAKVAARRIAAGISRLGKRVVPRHTASGKPLDAHMVELWCDADARTAQPALVKYGELVKVRRE